MSSSVVSELTQIVVLVAIIGLLIALFLTRASAARERQADRLGIHRRISERVLE